jgi:hypothetical protein
MGSFLSFFGSLQGLGVGGLGEVLEPLQEAFDSEEGTRMYTGKGVTIETWRIEMKIMQEWNVSFAFKCLSLLH